MPIPRLTGATVNVAGTLIRSAVGELASIKLAQLIVEQPLASLDLDAAGQPPIYVPRPYRAE